MKIIQHFHLSLLANPCKYCWHEYQRRMRASINSSCNEIYAVYRKKTLEIIRRRPTMWPNWKFSYARTSTIVFITRLVLRTTKCCTRNRIFRPAVEGMRQRECCLDLKIIALRFAAAYANGVEKKSHSRCPLYLMGDQRVPK